MWLKLETSAIFHSHMRSRQAIGRTTSLKPWRVHTPTLDGLISRAAEGPRQGTSYHEDLRTWCLLHRLR